MKNRLAWCQVTNSWCNSTDGATDTRVLEDCIASHGQFQRSIGWLSKSILVNNKGTH